jgi:hypothetical protein
MAETTESKKELQSKYDRAMARMRGMRKEMTETQAEMLDGALTIAGGAAGGAICAEWGPYGEGSNDWPVNLIAGLGLTALGMADGAGDFSGEVAAVGIGMLTFQAGLWTYGDGYQADDAVGYDDEVGAEPPRARRQRRKGARRATASRQRLGENFDSRALPQRTAMTYDRIQDMLRQGVAV